MNSLSLYKITHELESLLDGGIDEDGVISDELGAMLARFENKGKAVIAYILNQEATAAAVNREAEKLAKKAVAFERRAESLKEYLRDNMKRSGITQISAEDGTFTAKLYLERDESIEIFDEAQIPIAYMTIPKPPESKPDKARIKASLKAGTDVPGAKIAKRDRLTIS